MQLRKLTDEDYDSDMPLPFLDDPEPPKAMTMGEKYPFIPLATPEGAELCRLHSLIVDTTKTYFTEIGMYFKKAQSLYAKNKTGRFEAFIESTGYKRDTVYRLISRYNLIVANCDDSKAIEELPLSLSYEIAKPNIDPELKEKVISGEITTIKELEAWKEEKKKLEAKLLKVIDNSVKIEQELKAVKGADAHLRYQLDKMAKEQQQAVEKEVNARLKEELKKQQETLQEALRRQEAMVARLEDELTILRPLKRREEEILQKQKELDEAREEVHRAKARNVLFDAVTKARKSFNDAIYPVVTVAMTPEIYGDTLKKELIDLVEMTENFTYALKQKFNL